ncbi:MAG: DUF4190 domain-containing protein, partial [Chitinophagales bacterium]|nr:DUF4190 domain-containing protein [Chitinophagales bacterium]
IAHIVEEQPLVVKYYECDDKNKKLLLLSKSKIKRLRYANGKNIVIQQPTTNDTNTDPKPPQTRDNDYVEWNKRRRWEKMSTRVDPLGVISLLAAVAGFFIVGIFLETAAIVMGITALIRITRYPDRWKGIGFAIAGLILGIVLLALTILLLSIIL